MNQVDELGQRGPSMKMLHKFSQLAISGKMWAYQLGITKYYEPDLSCALESSDWINHSGGPGYAHKLAMS